MKWALSLGGAALFALAVMTSTAARANHYGMAGCGLGSMLMGADGGQVLAATTNSSSANQLFGITTGTSNCKADEATAARERQQNFIASNLVSLSKEMAQGDGKTLKAFSEVLGCGQDVFPEFQRQAKASYTNIFAAPGAFAVLQAAKYEFSENQLLSASCSWLI